MFTLSKLPQIGNVPILLTDFPLLDKAFWGASLLCAHWTQGRLSAWACGGGEEKWWCSQALPARLCSALDFCVTGFQINLLFGNDFRFMEKLKKQHKGFLHTYVGIPTFLHTTKETYICAVSTNVDILCYNGTFVKTKKLTWAHCSSLNYRLHKGFSSLATHVLFLFQDPVENGTFHLAV